MLPPSPEINNWLEWIWRAWHRLSLDRPIYGGGMGAPIPGRIPWHAVAEWAAFHDQDVVLLDKAVVAMDTVWLEWNAERMKAP